MPDQLLRGRSAVVTGSSRGIGRAVARSLAAEGARVVVNGRDEAATEEAAAEICSCGGSAIAHAGSVADFDVAGSLIERCAEEFGAIDILVNCAGIAEPPGSSILDLGADDWQRVIGAHLTSTFNTCRYAAPRMAERGAGAIVNTSSHGFLGIYGGSAYPAAKGGVGSLSLAMAAELREHGIRVNVVCPGARTRLSTGRAYEERIRDLHRRGLIDDVVKDASLDPPPPQYAAPLYALLVSDLAADITGRLFSASGGYVGLFETGVEKLLAYRDHRQHEPWKPAELAAVLRRDEGT